MTYKDLTIIITTFKSEQKIRECLSSIDPQINIILIENSSSIEFKKDIESNFSNVSCELTNDNLGYGKANNIGLKKVKTKILSSEENNLDAKSRTFCSQETDPILSSDVEISITLSTSIVDLFTSDT